MVFPWPVTIAVKIGVIFIFCLSCTVGKNSFVIPVGVIYIYILVCINKYIYMGLTITSK